MKVTRLPLIINASDYSREFDIERSQGIHLMEIVEYISKALGMDKTRYGDQEEDNQERQRIMTPGFIWERVMSEHARKMEGDASLSYPGEMMYCPKCDDVFPGHDVGRRHVESRQHKVISFTPDAIMLPPRRKYGPVEWKFTHLSSKRTGVDHIDGIWKWPVQLMWTAYLIDSDYAEIEAMFVRGDYSTNKPNIETYRFQLEFSERELKNNFDLILNTAKSKGWV